MGATNNINPEMLRWARETAGLNLEDAAQKLGFQNSTKNSAAAKLSKLEAGESFPTRNQLLKFSTVYRRPLISFYLNKIPTIEKKGEDYRSMASDISPRENAQLDALLRDIFARQEMVKNLLEEDEPKDLSFVASRTIGDGVSRVVTEISKVLDFNYLDVSKRKGTSEDLFKDIRARCEANGIFVLLVGDLGSYHSAISEKTFRGFVIADKVAPFVVINGQDAKAARVFTLLHELAHIWLGQTGVSGDVTTIESAKESQKVEQFCNDVAGEFLLPQQILVSEIKGVALNTKETSLQAVATIARRWSVSEPMTAYQIFRRGFLTRRQYSDLAATYAARWQSIKDQKKDKSEGGPDYFVVKQYKLGNALLDVVHRTLRSDLLTHTKAAKILGVNSGSVETLIKKYEARQFFPSSNLEGR